MSNSFECAICLKGQDEDDKSCILNINKKRKWIGIWKKRREIQENTSRKVNLYECGHQFHVDCLQNWLKNKNTCPLCRTKITYHFSIYFNKKKYRKKIYLFRIDEDKCYIYKLRNCKSNKNDTTKDFSDIYLNFNNKKSKKKIYKIIRYNELKKIIMVNDEKICFRDKNDNDVSFYTDYDQLFIINLLVKFSENYGLVNKINTETLSGYNSSLQLEYDRFRDDIFGTANIS